MKENKTTASENNTDIENTQTENETTQEKGFAIQRIYVKDISFETPNTPEIFTYTWQPEFTFNLETKVNQLQNDNFEVILLVSISAKIKVEQEEKIAFICEVQQAGIFYLQNFTQEETSHILLAQCPNILFPYARTLIANLVNNGSFPALNLDPINFDALYLEHLEKQAPENTVKN